MASVTRQYRRIRRPTDDGGSRFVYARDRSGNKITAGWMVKWRDHDGRQRTKRFDRKADADRFAAEVETDLARGTYVDPTAGRITLDAYIDRWLEAQVWRPSTRQLADSHIRNHIGPALGSRPLAQITRTDVQGFVRSLEGAGLAPTTVEAIYRRLVSILEAAVHDRVIARSPAVKIALPKKTRRQSDAVVILPMADVERLADTVPPWLRAFVWTIATSGLRPGEAAGLTLERIDLMRRELVVDRQLVTVIGQPPHLAPVKTVASIRTVPIPDALVHELNRHIAERPPIEVQRGATLIFTNRDGRPLRRNVLGDAWDKARTALELPAEARGWHTLRHTYASALIHAGLSVRAVQARLGHASATETLDTYAHLWPDSDDDTRAAVELALGEGDSARPASVGGDPSL